MRAASIFKDVVDLCKYDWVHREDHAESHNLKNCAVDLNNARIFHSATKEISI